MQGVLKIYVKYWYWSDLVTYREVEMLTRVHNKSTEIRNVQIIKYTAAPEYLEYIILRPTDSWYDHKPFIFLRQL